jgi:hypothetical protein
MTEPQKRYEEVLIVDGVEIDMDDFSFKEQREVRRLLHEHVALEWDRDKPWDEQLFHDIFPAVIAVYKQRDDPAYTVDQALELKPRDVIVSREVAPTPTKRGAAKRTAAKR